MPENLDKVTTGKLPVLPGDTVIADLTNAKRPILVTRLPDGTLEGHLVPRVEDKE